MKAIIEIRSDILNAKDDKALVHTIINSGRDVTLTVIEDFHGEDTKTIIEFRDGMWVSDHSEMDSLETVVKLYELEELYRKSPSTFFIPIHPDKQFEDAAKLADDIIDGFSRVAYTNTTNINSVISKHTVLSHGVKLINIQSDENGRLTAEITAPTSIANLVSKQPHTVYPLSRTIAGRVIVEQLILMPTVVN